MADLILQNFLDIHSKVIDEDGSVDFGILHFNRPFSFSLSSTPFSLTSSNTFVHFYDQNIYPTTLTSSTGFGVYATYNNSYSGYFHTTLMQLFNQNAIAALNGTQGGIFAATSLTSSLTSEIFNNGNYNPSFYQGDPTSLSSFTAQVTGFYVYCFDRSIFGERILDGTIGLYDNNETLIANENGLHRDSTILSLTSSVYANSLTSVTKFFVLPSNGKFITWSSNSAIQNSLSAISTITFNNSVSIANYTLNLHIEPNEFNLTDNQSFYYKYFNNGLLSQTWFSTIGIFNPWNDLLAVCKIQRPILKSNIPIDVKIIFDCI